MSDVTTIMNWVMQIEANSRALPHELLHVASDAKPEQIQSAFHAVAKQSHPDRFRNMLTAPQLDRLTRAYSRVTEAYAIMTGRVRRSVALPTTQSAAAAPVETPRVPAHEDPTSKMNGHALRYFRRAEAAFAINDTGNARLQLRMAVAADPQSAYLRRVLNELESTSK
jgi:curved DNA-binding protein CbpA